MNSALQRARAGMKSAGTDPAQASEPSATEQRAWLDRYTAAFVSADVEAIKALLTEDVLMEMPPMVNWFTGRDGYGQFMRWVYGVGGTDWPTRPVAANGQPGFAAYRRDGDGYALHTLQVLTVTADGVSRNSVFQDPVVFASFGLPGRLDGAGEPV
ncbi:nuclear transport factor 2 family protein [Luteimicrobium album]|uniref:nuclear transport factor 2 family protein n=1 Tax=Luteimicrobium album TaxID=1054550 RepID=UPI0024E06A63|nr:nuclear transport factor 2 family protein [Luteimicrobium album]